MPLRPCLQIPILRYGQIPVILCDGFVFGGVCVAMQLGEWGGGVLGVEVCIMGELGALAGGVMMAEYGGKGA